MTRHPIQALAERGLLIADAARTRAWLDETTAQMWDRDHNEGWSWTCSSHPGHTAWLNAYVAHAHVDPQDAIAWWADHWLHRHTDALCAARDGAEGADHEALATAFQDAAMMGNSLLWQVMPGLSCATMAAAYDRALDVDAATASPETCADRAWSALQSLAGLRARDQGTPPTALAPVATALAMQRSRAWLNSGDGRHPCAVSLLGLAAGCGNEEARTLLLERLRGRDGQGESGAVHWAQQAALAAHDPDWTARIQSVMPSTLQVRNRLLDEHLPVAWGDALVRWKRSGSVALQRRGPTHIARVCAILHGIEERPRPMSHRLANDIEAMHHWYPHLSTEARGLILGHVSAHAMQRGHPWMVEAVLLLDGGASLAEVQAIVEPHRERW
jgi:hypothetical protein